MPQLAPTRRRTSASSAFELQILGSNGWAREDITALLDLLQSGRLRAVVDATYPLERAAEALVRLEDRQVLGKLVIVP